MKLKNAEFLAGADESKEFERRFSKKTTKVKAKRAPRGLTMKLYCVKDGLVYFKIKATKFYLFKTILRIAGQNIRNPLLATLIFGYAFYYLVK